MKIEDERYLVFSTGRRETANLGIVGLGPDLTISEGYDGGFNERDWTPDERRELADYMIAQWTAYRDQVR